MSEKISYEPVQERRFVISPDSFSRERLKLLMDLKTEVENQLDFKTYLSLFGSLSKGKHLDADSAPQSDIDLDIFIDGEDMRDQHEAALVKDSRYATLYKHSLHEIDYGDEAVRQEAAQVLAMQGYVGWYLAEEGHKRAIQLGFPQSSIDKNVVHDLVVRAIWPDSIMKAVVKLDAIRMETGDQWMDEGKGKGPSEELAAFFHLNVGGGLNKYIGSFLTEASLSPDEQRNRYWEEIRIAVEKSERDGLVPEDMQGRFPTTFQAALQYYGSIE